MIDFIATCSFVWITSHVVHIAEYSNHRFTHQLAQDRFGLVKRKLDLVVLADDIQIVVVESTEFICSTSSIAFYRNM